jgi:hypothetical protein
MIPRFNRRGTLPPGIHQATWDELVARYGTNEQCLFLLDGLKQAALVLKAAGCSTLYVDGSFVTNEPHPHDFDGCWDNQGVDEELLEPMLQELSHDSAAQKAEYGGELYAVKMRNVGRYFTYLEFFQRDRDGYIKGIIALDLKELSDGQE